MTAFVVYESVFGNTHTVAEEVAAGLRDALPDEDVRCLPIALVRPAALGSCRLLVIGGPTHLRGLSSRLTRQLGARSYSAQRRPDGRDDGLRSWFNRLEDGDGRPAAAFDTRLGSRLAGGAADDIADQLQQHGYRLATPPMGFVVDEAPGPLRSGERTRARAWGADLGQYTPLRSDGSSRDLSSTS